MSDEHDPMLELPQLQIHRFDPMRISPDICDFCGGPPQAHPTPEALAALTEHVE